MEAVLVASAQGIRGSVETKMRSSQGTHALHIIIKAISVDVS